MKCVLSEFAGKREQFTYLAIGRYDEGTRKKVLMEFDGHRVRVWRYDS